MANANSPSSGTKGEGALGISPSQKLFPLPGHFLHFLKIIFAPQKRIFHPLVPPLEIIS